MIFEENILKVLITKTKHMLNKVSICVLAIFTLTQLSTVYAQNPQRFFPKSDLMTIGSYYYPEQWPRSQWERDLKKLAETGFEFTHFGEFAWAFVEPKDGVFDFKW